jgi:hypothetical protein
MVSTNSIDGVKGPNVNLSSLDSTSQNLCSIGPFGVLTDCLLDHLVNRISLDELSSLCPLPWPHMSAWSGILLAIGLALPLTHPLSPLTHSCSLSQGWRIEELDRECKRWGEEEKEKKIKEDIVSSSQGAGEDHYVHLHPWVRSRYPIFISFKSQPKPYPWFHNTCMEEEGY